MSKIKDPKLAKQGEGKIYWAEKMMPVLMSVRKEFSEKKPFKGVTIACCLHVTKETAVLAKTLKAGGAKVLLCAANPLSTQDDVAAALATAGVEVYAWRGEDQKQYYENIDTVLDQKPNITIDDGGDLVSTIHKKRRELIKNVYGGCEETTTGVIRLKAMARDGALKYPIIAVNDALTKHLFDNRYGTGQSTIDGILRATSVMLSGKNFVVCGYGWCGRGVAMRAHGMGANVIVTETDPLKALEAVMDGYRVMPIKEAAKIGDVFVTVTGDKNVISQKTLKVMKNGAIVANSGHFNVEIDVEGLGKISTGKKKVRENVEEYSLKNGKKIYLLGEGRIINLVAAEGHPSSVMDLSFCCQALSAKYILDKRGKLQPGVHTIPRQIDEKIARLKLKTMGVKIDSLSQEQKKYLTSWKEGTH